MVVGSRGGWGMKCEPSQCRQVYIGGGWSMEFDGKKKKH